MTADEHRQEHGQESNEDTTVNFADLGLSEPVLKALDDVGYENPSPIQAQTIPLVLAGGDVLGQAQTGTGKTAAFALPLLTKLQIKSAVPQVLVLVPTRELAIQVAEAFQRYAAHMKGFHVLPIYGGQAYGGQLRQLQRGVHVVVGTPGRVMDHMRRGTLDLEYLSCLVLDEADEMLRMGFIDDVQWILEQTPEERQVALFSATMPNEIRQIAQRHLKNPDMITIKVRTTTAETIRQRFIMVHGFHKLDALTRILESETFEGMIVFVRTKTATVELAEKLEARGFSSAALNGDIPQAGRERTVEQLKNGKIDILVATDVAARGLDVDRISHVVNYDIPYDTEAYVHRIGRTGRAGRSGEAILFVAPRERRMLRAIERATGGRVEQMQRPSSDEINTQRVARFKQRIQDTLDAEDLSFYHELIAEYMEENEGSEPLDIAAALARLFQGDRPMLLPDDPKPRPIPSDRPVRRTNAVPPRAGMDRYRLEVGEQDGVRPGNIVGAIANEVGIESRQIGRIDIRDDYSLVDLPANMHKDQLSRLRRVWVSGRQLKASCIEVGARGGFDDRKKRRFKTRPKFKDGSGPFRKPKK